MNDANCLTMSQQLLQALRSFSKLEKAVSAGKGYQVRSLSTLVTISRLWLICWGWFYSMLVHGQYWDNSAGKECFLLSRTVTWSGRPSLDRQTIKSGPFSDMYWQVLCENIHQNTEMNIYLRINNGPSEMYWGCCSLERASVYVGLDCLWELANMILK